jgi:hypothetical protein
VALAALGGVVTALSGEEFSEMSVGAARLIAAFAIVSMVIPAIGEFEIPKLPDRESMSECITGGYSEVSREAFAYGIAEAVSQRLNIDSEMIAVTVDGFSFNIMRAGGLRVVLPPEAALSDVRGLAIWLEENFLSEGGRCEVVIDFE